MTRRYALQMMLDDLVHNVSQGLQQIEEELHIELLPGTELMTDVGTHHFVKKYR